MKSFFIGVGLFFAFVVSAPITVLWVFGERYQGRRQDFWERNYGIALGIITFAWCFFGLILCGASRSS